MQQLPSSSVHPLETLALQQLQELKHEEQSLAERYAAIEGAEDGGAATFLLAVSRLHRRADRLHRFIEEMSLFDSGDTSLQLSPVPA